MKRDTEPVPHYIPAYTLLIIAALLICTAILSAGCLRTEQSPAPLSEPDDSAAHAQMLEILGTLQGDINTQLLTLDRTAAETAAELSENCSDTGTACTSDALNTLLNADPSGKTVVTIAGNGTVLSGIPKEETEMLIGKNLGTQSVVQTLFSTKQALMSDLFSLEQGGYAAVIEYPVFSEDDCLTGLVSLAFAPHEIIGRYAVPAVVGTPYTIMAAQTDGRILYDADPREIGKETFNEPLYEDYPEIMDFARNLADTWSGYGTYSFYDTGFDRVVQKEAYWTTIGMHGTEWRLLIIREDVPGAR